MTLPGHVPAAIARLWRLSTQSRTGRPALLSVDRVVQAAVGVADRDGLSHVSLATIAAELGVAKMALYRHVGSKSELLQLMSDHALGPLPTLPDKGGWRGRLRQWTMSYRAAFLDHPWLAEIPVSGPPAGPNAIAWVDAMLATVADTPLDWGTKMQALGLLAGYVRQTSLELAELAEHRHTTGIDATQAERDHADALSALVDPGTFPHAAAMLASDIFDGPDAADLSAHGPDYDYDFEPGLDLILGGVNSAITAVRRARTPTTRH